jgi:hypothetical protein
MSDKMKNLITRAITGVFFVAAVVTCFLRPEAMIFLFALVTGLTVWEFTGIVNNIENVSVNRDWGNVKRISTTNILKYENGAYTFNKPTWSKYAGTISTWSAMFSIRYTFN